MRGETQENAALLHEFQREIVDDVPRLQNLAIDSKTDGEYNWSVNTG